MMTKYDPDKHHRCSIRLKGYDYSQAGAYFVTVVAYQRECLFGKVVNGEMISNRTGQIIQWEWENLAQSFHFIELGLGQVMPNHFHGILVFHDVGATQPGVAGFPKDGKPLRHVVPVGLSGSPLRPNGLKPASLGAIVGQFKSRVTKRLWKIPSLNGKPIWQRNYYERIIRDENEMDRIWQYIESNPTMWDDDEENPAKL